MAPDRKRRASAQRWRRSLRDGPADPCPPHDRISVLGGAGLASAMATFRRPDIGPPSHPPARQPRSGQPPVHRQSRGSARLLASLPFGDVQGARTLTRSPLREPGRVSLGNRRKQGREQLVQYRGGAYVLCGSPLAEASVGMRELGSRRAECRSPIRSPAPGCPGACTWLSVRRFCIASYPRLDRGLDAGWRVLQGHLSTRLRLRPRDATGVRGRCGRCAGRDGQDRAGSCRRCRIGRGSDSRRS